MSSNISAMPTMMSGKYGGSDDPCILGYTNGTYPNGTVGMGSWHFGIYMPTSAEKAPCQAAHDPWAGTVYYGWWTNYFILAGVTAVAIVTALKRFHSLNRVMDLPSIVIFPPRLSALFRLGSYPQLSLLGGAIPPLGPSFLLFGFFLFSTGVCFLRRPYYRPPNYGSSPLGLRSEWIATALVPWIFATATKRNFLVFFTGITFRRVMTFHKWVPWVCLYMSIVHTWAMIIRANRQEPWWYTIKTNPVYWNGFPPLVALVWLCVMSLGPIRSRFYETFFIWHMIAALFFVIWMYIHLANSLKSWQYMHAAVVLWGAAVLWRVALYAFDHGWFTRIPRASIESVSFNAIIIRVPMPSNRVWTAGAHVYIRFLSIRPWESHPFTIASLPAPPTHRAGDNDKDPARHQMVFLVRPRDGMTARLRTLVASSATPCYRACLVDGPYGGSMEALRACDTVVLIAGGSGMSAIIPVAQALKRAGPKLGMTCCRQVEVIWAIREPDALEWFKEQLSEVGGIDVYLTSQADSQAKVKLAVETLGDIAEEIATGSSSSIVQAVKRGRPDLSALIYGMAACYSGRLGVLVCGPSSMTLDVRCAVTHLQKSILLSSPGVICEEVELHEESFDM